MKMLNSKQIKARDLIEEAIIHTERLALLMDDFSERWFNTAKPSENTLFDVAHRYGLLQAHIYSMCDDICEVKTRLHAVVGEADDIFKAKQSSLEEMKTIIDFAKEQ
ncbi:MAG: hypothetical protein IJW16_00090 [Clostridia bacterium]|nr:hypothetical protein [Clostridia bacterium]